MIHKFPDARILVFCKAPIPGQVKTRLIPALTSDEAADLHIDMIRKTLELVCRTALCPIELWCSPSIDHPFFDRCVEDFGITLHSQHGNNLGEKMHHAFCSALSSADHALLIGCDCASFAQHDMVNALTALHNHHDAVLAPAQDGGYVLIGLNKPQPELFDDINWGTNNVLETTRNRINELRLDCFELPEQWDVDTPEDLKKFRLLRQNLL